MFDGRPYDFGSGRLGISVAAGDFNGDGFSDVVGAEFARYVGGADVFYGSASGPSPANAWSLGPHVGRALGSSVAAADVNGDGYDDLVVTSSDDGEGLTPRAIVYLGSASGLPTGQDGNPPGVPPDFSLDGLENAVSLGDLDGDGYDDFVALARDPNSRPFPSHVVYRGSASGPILAQELGGVLGVPGRLNRLGDVNGDGFPDLVAQDGSTFYLYFGSDHGLSAALRRDGDPRRPCSRMRATSIATVSRTSSPATPRTSGSTCTGGARTGPSARPATSRSARRPFPWAARPGSTSRSAMPAPRPSG